MAQSNGGFDRRRFTAFFAAFGLAGTALPRILWATVEEQGAVNLEALRSAEQLSGLEFTDAERELMLERARGPAGGLCCAADGPDRQLGGAGPAIPAVVAGDDASELAVGSPDQSAAADATTRE